MSTVARGVLDIEHCWLIPPLTETEILGAHLCNATFRHYRTFFGPIFISSNFIITELISSPELWLLCCHLYRLSGGECIRCLKKMVFWIEKKNWMEFYLSISLLKLWNKIGLRCVGWQLLNSCGLKRQHLHYLAQRYWTKKSGIYS
jgi:hypothetical protein